MRTILSALALLGLTTVAQCETIRLGLYYDVARDGHGFDLHRAGDTYILYFYTYDGAGDPEWLVGIGQFEDGVVSGDLLRFTYDAAMRPPQVRDESFDGSFSLDWRELAVTGACNDGVDRSGATGMASFRWQTRGDIGVWCTQLLFGGGAADSAEPYVGGIWYAGEEDPGYGFSMAQQDNTTSAIVYYYDAEGEPRWALGVAPRGGVIDLSSFEGYCRNCESRPRVESSAGTLALDWDIGGPPGAGMNSASLLLAYPAPPFGNFDRSFAPARLSDGEATHEVTVGIMPTQAFFDTFVSDQTVQARCVTCHRVGGVSGGTRLVFERSNTENYRRINLDQIRNLVAETSPGLIRNKVRGFAGHGGGVQLREDDPRYIDLSLLLDQF